MDFNVKVLAAALAASLNLILIVFVSLRKRRHIVYRSFLLISFCLLLWNLRVILSSLIAPGNTDSFLSILITQLFYPVVTACLYILPVATLQFTVSFIGLKAKALQTIVQTTYVLAFFLSIIYASHLLSSRTYDHLLWLFILPLFVMSLLLLGRAYFRARRPLERTRFGLLLVGGTVGVLGAITEDILNASAVNAGGLGNIANATYSLLVAICLFRHRLFDVSVTTRRTIGFAMTALLLFLVAYTFFSLFRLSTLIPYGHLFITALLLLVLGRRIMPHTERILFRRSKHVYQTIDDIRHALDSVHNLSGLFKIVAEITKKNIGVTRCLCVARDEIMRRYRCHWPQSEDATKVVESTSFIEVADWTSRRANVEPLFYDEICHSLNFGSHDGALKKQTATLKENMESIGYEVFIPLSLERNLEGAILLGEKNNGQAFTESDARFLKILSYNCSLRLQHLRMLERIRQLEELAALGEMAAYVAHEVKNPLTIIRSSAQLMIDQQHDDKTSNMIIEECDRLNRVVTRMLNFAKAPEPHPQCINISKEIKKWTGELSQSPKSSNIELSVEYPANVPDIKFDPDHLKQIITNLLLNALESMQESGRIVITLTNTLNMVQLAISDSGPGIRHKDQHDIFKPFYTTKPGGSGLGLPITRRLIELNNGVIAIESYPGKGCTVKLGLPIWST
ncbi:MAG: ATP-binding protein [bacterium]